MATFPTVRIVPPPPPGEWTWQDCLGISERYRKEPLDLALKQIFLLLTINSQTDDRLWVTTKHTARSVLIMDRLDPLGKNYVTSNWATEKNKNPNEVDFTTGIFKEILGHCLETVLKNKASGISYEALFKEKYLQPLRAHQDNVQAWQSRRIEAIWQRVFVMAPVVRLIGWVCRLVLGIAAKEAAVAHSKDPNYRYDSGDWPISLQFSTYQYLDKYLENSTTCKDLLTKIKS